MLTRGPEAILILSDIRFVGPMDGVDFAIEAKMSSGAISGALRHAIRAFVASSRCTEASFPRIGSDVSADGDFSG